MGSCADVPPLGAALDSVDPACEPPGGITVATFGVRVGAGVNVGAGPAKDAQPVATSASTEDIVIPKARRYEAVLAAAESVRKRVVIRHHGTCRPRRCSLRRAGATMPACRRLSGIHLQTIATRYASAFSQR